MKSEKFFPIIDAHSHLWLKQDTTWNDLKIKTSEGNSSRSFFLDQEVQMLPPFMIDGKNSAEVFLSNMDYAQVSAAVVTQEFIDGIQNPERLSDGGAAPLARPLSGLWHVRLFPSGLYPSGGIAHPQRFPCHQDSGPSSATFR